MRFGRGVRVTVTVLCCPEAGEPHHTWREGGKGLGALGAESLEGVAPKCRRPAATEGRRARGEGPGPAGCLVLTITRGGRGGHGGAGGAASGWRHVRRPGCIQTEEERGRGGAGGSEGE